MALTKDELFTFLNKKLGIDTGSIDESTLLFSSGMIDSFSLMSLISFIEKRGSFRMSPLEVSLENMDSVERILSYVDRKTAGSAG